LETLRVQFLGFGLWLTVKRYDISNKLSGPKFLNHHGFLKW